MTGTTSAWNRKLMKRSNWCRGDVSTTVEHVTPGWILILRLIIVWEVGPHREKPTRVPPVNARLRKALDYQPHPLTDKSPYMIMRLLEASTSGTNVSRSQHSPRCSIWTTRYKYPVSCPRLNCRKTLMSYMRELHYEASRCICIKRLHFTLLHESVKLKTQGRHTAQLWASYRRRTHQTISSPRWMPIWCALLSRLNLLKR